MDIFLKATASVLIAVVLYQTVFTGDKNIAALLGIMVCCMVLLAAITFLDPVLVFLRQLQSLGNIDSEMLRILMKSVGIGLLSEVASLICKDMGNAAMGKGIQILGSAAVLWISLPLMNGLLELLTEIFGVL